MFGDNESVVTSSTVPHLSLNKRWMALSCHRVREAIASGMLSFWHVPGAENAADVLSKHWSHHEVSDVLIPMLCWHRDAADIVPNLKCARRSWQGTRSF